MLKDFFTQRIKRGLVRRLNNFKIANVAKQVAKQEPQPSGQPVVFFKASTGIDDLSWNSGFHLLASWAFRLKGIPVAYFACNSGMSKCVLGTNRDNPYKEMPCKTCVEQASALYAGVQVNRETSKQVDRFTGTQVNWFGLDRDSQLVSRIAQLSLHELSTFQFQNIPLGNLCLPALRWILRIHHLNDDENTRYLLREYILSAWNVAQKFSKFLDETNPRAVIVFNGQFFPEATARFIAQQRGIRVITHEVGLQPATAYFTDGEATAYPIHIPADFELNDEQNKKLDAYLAKRFQGDFTMAGIKFWADMKGLDESFLQKASEFKQIVPVFTNVIFDTSQPHANTVFEDMFDWLDLVLEIIKEHPETLFVIRAHPDELRVRKASRETVAGWVEARNVSSLPNVIFVASNESLSSYELILKSKFVMVYNSTIGLEASIMGMPVLCAGKARFTQYPTVFFPQTVEDVKNKTKEFLSAERIEVPADFKRNARRFLYYQLYKTSLPFGDFLEPSVRTTQTKLKSFSLDELIESESVQVILDGVLGDEEFLLRE
ncbi:MAG: capsule polysaccharide biosynthesis family protein [Chloroflexi bacterium OLB14]|nr:MAG: capsule polysaccharide biosynthesis family protein [Chloroflexi bacterium OLB14]